MGKSISASGSRIQVLHLTVIPRAFAVSVFTALAFAAIVSPLAAQEGFARIIVANDTAYTIIGVEIDGRPRLDFSTIPAASSAELLVEPGERKLAASVNANGNTIWVEQAGGFASGGNYRWSVTEDAWRSETQEKVKRIDPYDYLRPQAAISALPPGTILGDCITAAPANGGFTIRSGEVVYGPYRNASGIDYNLVGGAFGFLIQQADGWIVLINGKTVAGPYPGNCWDLTFSGWGWASDQQQASWAFKRSEGKNQWLIVDGKEYGPFGAIQELLLGPKTGYFIASVRAVGTSKETLLVDGIAVSNDWDDIYAWDAGRTADPAIWTMPVRRGGDHYIVINGIEYGPFASINTWPMRRSGGRLAPFTDQSGKQYVIIDGKTTGPYDWYDTGNAKLAGLTTLLKVGHNGRDALVINGLVNGPFNWVDENSLWVSPDGTKYAARVNMDSGAYLITQDGLKGPFVELDAKRIGEGEHFVTFYRTADGKPQLADDGGSYAFDGYGSRVFRPDNLDHWAVEAWNYRLGAKLSFIIIDGVVYSGRSLRTLRINGKYYFTWVDDRTYNIRPYFLEIR